MGLLGVWLLRHSSVRPAVVGLAVDASCITPLTPARPRTPDAGTDSVTLGRSVSVGMGRGGADLWSATRRLWSRSVVPVSG